MRRIWPAILITLTLLIDTSVLPMLTRHWAVPLMLYSTVIVLGLLLGRINGLLYGMIGGLLMDILVGYPLGLMAVVYMVAGYLSGMAGRKYQRFLLTVVLTPALCFLAYEITMAVYMFFAGQTIDAPAMSNALMRVVIQTVLTQFLYLLYNRLLKPKWSRYAAR